VDALVVALAGVLAGATISHGAEWLRRRQRRRAHRAALRAEIDYCRWRAETYQADDVAAPLYRLPAVTYSSSLPALLSDGVVSEPGVRALVAFFSEVETVNRGLDLVQAARERDDQQAMRAEYDRNLLKIQSLLALHRSAREAADGHL
jgi:hypothetical protein